MKYGYMRVSTSEQNLSRQEQELKKYNLNKIISDKSTGKKINNNLSKLLKNINANDEIVVLSLDRLGRSLENNLKIMTYLQEKNVKFRSIKENIIIDSDEHNPMNEFIFSMFSLISQLERSLILERQKEGIEARKRKNKFYNKQSENKYNMINNKDFQHDVKHNNREFVMNKYNISVATYFNYKREIISKPKK